MKITKRDALRLFKAAKAVIDREATDEDFIRTDARLHAAVRAIERKQTNSLDNPDHP